MHLTLLNLISPTAGSNMATKLHQPRLHFTAAHSPDGLHVVVLYQVLGKMVSTTCQDVDHTSGHIRRLQQLKWYNLLIIKLRKWIAFI